jgi:hypothetical protein
MAVAIRRDDTDGREPRRAHRIVEIHAFSVEHVREQTAEPIRGQSSKERGRTAQASQADRHIERRAARNSFGRESGTLLAGHKQIDERFAANEDHVVSPPAELSTS